MRAQSPSSADMRAFRWHLAPLERKLESSIESTRRMRAELQRRSETVKRALDVLAERRRSELKAASAARSSSVDPVAHARVLRYLMQVSAEIEGKHAEATELHRQIRRARQDCLDAERQLECVVRMREAAQAAYAAGQFRALAKESDMAWLAVRASRDPQATGPDGGGA